ncbi:MAG TPA: hypothetical protein VLX92_22625 [Kofleriaceae bacterium]|nr:hypothetical protein [Kofleriaceae bacterium]
MNVVFAALAVIGGCTDSADPTSSTPASAQAGPSNATLRDPQVKARLRAAVLPHASSAGVASPATMHAVAASDHQAAETIVSGSTIDDHAPVYVVEMTGGPFTVPHRRPGAPAAHSDVMIVTVDAATYRVTDIGYPVEAPELSRIDPDEVDLLAP